MIRVLHLPVSGDPEVLDIERHDLAELQRLVGGWIEGVSVPGWVGDAHAYVNEEGLLQRLTMNPVASVVLGRHIVGPALILGTDGEDDGSIPEDLLTAILQVTS